MITITIIKTWNVIVVCIIIISMNEICLGKVKQILRNEQLQRILVEARPPNDKQGQTEGEG